MSEFEHCVLVGILVLNFVWSLILASGIDQILKELRRGREGEGKSIYAVKR